MFELTEGEMWKLDVILCIYMHTFLYCAVLNLINLLLLFQGVPRILANSEASATQLSSREMMIISLFRFLDDD